MLLVGDIEIFSCDVLCREAANIFVKLVKNRVQYIKYWKSAAELSKMEASDDGHHAIFRSAQNDF